MKSRTLKHAIGYLILAATVITLSAMPSAAAVTPGTAQAVEESLGAYGQGIRVKVEGDSVYLSGGVGTYGEKQEILARAERAAGNKVVQEKIEVFGGNDA